jgi:hypothetical protein
VGYLVGARLRPLGRSGHSTRRDHRSPDMSLPGFPFISPQRVPNRASGRLPWGPSPMSAETYAKEPLRPRGASRGQSRISVFEQKREKGT